MENVYKNAIYALRLPRGWQKIRIGRFHQKIDQHLKEQKKQTWLWITAENPRSELLRKPENKTRQVRLKSIFNRRGLPILEAYSEGALKSWPREWGLVVLGLKKKEALDLGKLFKQNAILWGHRGGRCQLLWCEDKELACKK